MVKPSARGLRKLRRLAKGPGVGKLKVRVEFTYKPTGGTANSKTRAYTLKLR